MKRFEWVIWGNIKVIIHLIDIDPTNGNLQIGLEICWK